MITITNEINKESSFIGYYPNQLDKSTIHKIKQYCSTISDYKSGKSGWGSDIPRLQKWFQQDGYDFSYRWKSTFPRWNAHLYDNELLNIQDFITSKCRDLLNKKVNFNSCLINYYRNEQDSIKPHTDSHELFGYTPCICLLSLGEERLIKFTRKKFNQDNIKSLKQDKMSKHLDQTILLKEGSLLIMDLATQKYYMHEIPKEMNKKKPRWSMTFRQFIIS